MTEKIDLSKPKYDQTTYYGRLRHFIDVTSPLSLFTSQKKLDTSISLLKNYQDGTLNKPVTSDELYDALRIKQAIVHPETGKPIPFPFRMSFFVPANLLIVLGMLQARTIPSTVFWQVVNQTYNVCVNYANSSSSNVLNTQQLTTTYLAAVASSVGTAVGLNEWIKRDKKLSPTMKARISPFVPFLAVCVANICNIGLMRKQEMTQGIPVVDKDGNEYGKSKIAGKNAVFTTILTRCAIVGPILIFPPIIYEYFMKFNFMKNAMFHTPMNLLIIAVCLQTALPACIALFPQNSEIDAKKLEPEFHDLKDKNGNKIEKLYFNKGL